MIQIFITNKRPQAMKKEHRNKNISSQQINKANQRSGEKDREKAKAKQQDKSNCKMKSEKNNKEINTPYLIRRIH